MTSLDEFREAQAVSCATHRPNIPGTSTVLTYRTGDTTVILVITGQDNRANLTDTPRCGCQKQSDEAGPLGTVNALPTPERRRTDVRQLPRRTRGTRTEKDRPAITPVDPPGPPGNWSLLTEAEFRVAELVADGLTNREIADRLVLSPHTIDSHLRHVFTKLQVNNRVQMTRRCLMEVRGQQ